MTVRIGRWQVWFSVPREETGWTVYESRWMRLVCWVPVAATLACVSPPPIPGVGLDPEVRMSCWTKAMQTYPDPAISDGMAGGYIRQKQRTELFNLCAGAATSSR